MRTLTIRLNKAKWIDYVLVNGRNVPFKYDAPRRCFVGKVESETSKVVITLDKYNPLYRWTWWIAGMFFFIITVFGIFDLHENFKFAKEYELHVFLNEGDNVLDLHPSRTRGCILDYHANCEVDEVRNEFVQDRVLSRRNALLILSKWLFVLALIAGGVLAASFLLG